MLATSGCERLRRASIALEKKELWAEQKNTSAVFQQTDRACDDVMIVGGVGSHFLNRGVVSSRLRCARAGAA